MQTSQNDFYIYYTRLFHHEYYTPELVADQQKLKKFTLFTIELATQNCIILMPVNPMEEYFNIRCLHEARGRQQSYEP